MTKLKKTHNVKNTNEKIGHFAKKSNVKWVTTQKCILRVLTNFTK